MSTYEISDRIEFILYDESEGDYYLNLTHDINHSGYIRDGDPIVEGDQSDCDFKITCKVTKSGGLPNVTVSVTHDAFLNGFVPESDPEHLYVFRVFVKENDDSIDWASGSGTPPKEKAEVIHSNIINMPLGPKGG